MTGCCILDCNNKGEEGYVMKRFPINPLLKKIWLETIRRKKWKPKQYSAVCEVHFAKKMWEKPRQDGKKKLKTQAVPTIFGSVSDAHSNKRTQQAE
ncbi:peroxynitrite isomerase THAP4-like [Monomorium pharaonis]|uniref:peroxynitrite isomerase THAP4-like n=1 Tax=Monomorium pharaonis TaxID=307658 RepID=UPI001746EB18|nr:peroxynitrite isomerase THAP4-like [Monomorium pharaonis]XP_036139046.1 peroxynitrite isomerase THAP4-like [Monomorium pharaonis]